MEIERLDNFKIYILRHAKACGQQIEAELTEEGQEIAKQIVPVLDNYFVNNIFSSPMKRAIETVSPFAHYKNMRINTVEALSEHILSDVVIEDCLSKLKLTFTNFDI